MCALAPPEGSERRRRGSPPRSRPARAPPTGDAGQRGPGRDDQDDRRVQQADPWGQPLQPGCSQWSRHNPRDGRNPPSPGPWPRSDRPQPDAERHLRCLREGNGLCGLGGGGGRESVRERIMWAPALFRAVRPNRSGVMCSAAGNLAPDTPSVPERRSAGQPPRHYTSGCIRQAVHPLAACLPVTVHP